MLRSLQINLEMSKKLRRSIVPQVTTDCLLRYINWELIEDLSIDSLTRLPDLSGAHNLRNLFLAFRSEGVLRFRCSSKKLTSVQLASCNLGHTTALDFPQLPASDILQVLKHLHSPDQLLHLRLRRIRITDQVREMCNYVSLNCSKIKMFTFTTLPLTMSFRDMLDLRLNLGLVAFSARCNGAAASDNWPTFWPSMKYFWPKGCQTITPFTVFSTDFAFDELNINPEDEWKKLSPDQLDRYVDICNEVKRVFVKAYPQKNTFCSVSEIRNSLGQYLFKKWKNKKDSNSVEARGTGGSGSHSPARGSARDRDSSREPTGRAPGAFISSPGAIVAGSPGLNGMSLCPGNRNHVAPSEHSTGEGFSMRPGISTDLAISPDRRGFRSGTGGSGASSSTRAEVEALSACHFLGGNA